MRVLNKKYPKPLPSQIIYMVSYFYSQNETKVSSYVIYFTFFGIISFDVPFTSLKAMARNNK